MFFVVPNKPKTLLVALFLLCSGASAAQEPEVMFTIWDDRGSVVHKAINDGKRSQSTILGEDAVPVREIPSVLFAPPPKYPKRLADLRMEGWVRLKFTITEEGKVADPEVLDQHPRKYFARAALQTIRRYKFDVPTLDGRQTSLPDVTVRMIFDPDE